MTRPVWGAVPALARQVSTPALSTATADPGPQAPHGAEDGKADHRPGTPFPPRLCFLNKLRVFIIHHLADR